MGDGRGPVRVEQGHASTRPQDARELAHRGIRVVDVLQHPFADQNVDRGVVDGQRVGRPVDERGGRAHASARREATALSAGLGSTPVAVPVGPTLAARRTVLAPVPEPTSSATSPGAMASRSKAQSRNRITLGCAA